MADMVAIIIFTTMSIHMPTMAVTFAYSGFIVSLMYELIAIEYRDGASTISTPMVINPKRSFIQLQGDP
uniref:SSD domain-containing protein n=1 Tax=Ascaris lumbricoides TaxID=6252 RepID=A0A0M3HVD3_ASCLU